MNYLGYMWADRGERLEEAKKQIKKAVELEPKNPSYRLNLSSALAKAGNSGESQKEKELYLKLLAACRT